MSYRNGRSSSYGPPPRSPLPSLYPELERRERSVADRKPYTPLDDEAYRVENMKLYPPTGYSMEPRRRVNVDGKRRMVGGGPNREWEPKIQSRYDAFKAEQKTFDSYNTDYEATRQRLRESEERRQVTQMYKDSPLPGSHDRNGSQVYDPRNHARLYPISSDREEAAYR